MTRSAVVKKGSLRVRLVAVLPALCQHAGKKPEPQLMLECPDRVISDNAARYARHRPQTGTIHVPRHPSNMWHGGEIEGRVVWRLHVELGLLVQDGPTNAMPAEPPTEIRFFEAFSRNDVMNDHARCVEAAETGGSGAEAPFALPLTS